LVLLPFIPHTCIPYVSRLCNWCFTFEQPWVKIFLPSYCFCCLFISYVFYLIFFFLLSHCLHTWFLQSPLPAPIRNFPSQSAFLQRSTGNYSASASCHLHQLMYINRWQTWRTITTGVHKSWVPVHPGNQISYPGTSYLWVFKMELASYHPFGTWNFDAAFRFFENIGTPLIAFVPSKGRCRHKII